MENKNQPATGFCNVLAGYVNNGLTKRELIAAMAMQGILSNSFKENDTSKWLETFAEQSVLCDDALLTQLNKTL